MAGDAMRDSPHNRGQGHHGQGRRRHTRRYFCPRRLIGSADDQRRGGHGKRGQSQADDEVEARPELCEADQERDVTRHISS